MSPELYQTSKQILAFLTKHSAVFYISFILLVLSGAIYLLYAVVQTTFAPPTSTISTIKGFDDATIQKIKDLHDSSTGNAQANLPCPRLDPFSEQHLHCIYLIGAQLKSYQAANKTVTPSSDTLCTFVKTYLNGTSCTETSKNYTDDQGKPFTVQYHYNPKASNEIGYWDSSVCSDKVPNTVVASADSNRFALVTLIPGSGILCADY